MSREVLRQRTSAGRRIGGSAGVWLLVVWLAATGSVSAGERVSEAAWAGGWFASVRRLVGLDVGGAAQDPLEAAVERIAAVDATPPALALAGVVSAEGHWTFANRRGQRFTAAGPKEMARLYQALAPDIAGPPAPVIVYVAGHDVIAHPEHLSLLPREARLRLVVGRKSHPLSAFGTGARRVWFAEVGRNVFARVADGAQFAETLWQLGRRLDPQRFRVVALEPAGPDTFRPKPRRAGTAERQAVDRIKPASLADALSTLAGQWVVVTGRIDKQALVYRTPTGSEYRVPLAPIEAAAARADVNLVIVGASAPRQPGARNWLWLSVEVDGLFDAMKRATLGDFLDGLAGGGGRLFVEAGTRSPERVHLRVVPMRGGRLEQEPDTISSVLAELVSEVAGSVVPHSVDASLVSRARQRELDWRLLPGVPVVLHVGLAGLLLLGVVGLPLALGWWRAIWPAEARADYGDRFGYETARAIRWALFAVLFLPIVAVPALIFGVVRLVRWITGIGRKRRGNVRAPAA